MKNYLNFQQLTRVGSLSCNLYARVEVNPPGYLNDDDDDDNPMYMHI